MRIICLLACRSARMNQPALCLRPAEPVHHRRCNVAVGRRDCVFRQPCVVATVAKDERVTDAALPAPNQNVKQHHRGQYDDDDDGSEWTTSPYPRK